MIRTLPLLAVSALALSACADDAPQGEATPAAETDMVAEAPAQTATATLTGPDGAEMGTATAREENGVLMISVNAMGLTPGAHGAHIHTTGDCSASDFTSAGGHWNPEDVNHGIQSEQPNPHAGDLSNIEVSEDGTGTLEGESTGTFEGLFDADGSAFVIHAEPDDYKTQPSGDAGDRVACGVFERG